HERPAVIFPLLDQVQLVATAWAVLDLPELAGRRERQAVGGPNAGGPGFRGGLIAVGEGICADRLRGLGRFGVLRRIDQRNGGRASLAEVGVARRRLAVQRQTKDLAGGLIRILRRREA